MSPAAQRFHCIWPIVNPIATSGIILVCCVSATRCSSGVVNAVEPLLLARFRRVGGARASARKIAAPASDRDGINVPVDSPRYRLRRVLVDAGRASRLLLRLRERGAVAALPPDGGRTGVLQRRLPRLRTVNRRFAEAVAEEAAADRRSCSSRTITSRSRRRSSAGSCRSAASPLSGTFPGPTPKRSRSARGAARCSRGCWAAPPSDFRPQRICNNFFDCRRRSCWAPRWMFRRAP